MKKAFTLLCLLAMMATSLSVKAQEVTITLMPGWTWISCPGTEVQDFATALGSFTPMEGDIIKSQWGNSTYRADGHWRGSISQFYPGYGYMYYSNRPIPVTVTFNAQQPTSQVLVTTSEPMLITGNSAMGGGEVVSSDGTYILVRGLCWATHETPTSNDNYLEKGSGEGSFSATMTGLNWSTTYYYRAYAVTPSGTVYGEQQSFTTRDGIPTLTTNDITSITAISATSGGNITDNGGLNVTARGVCWSTSPNPTVSDNHTSNETGIGEFTSSITGLNDSTTYYVRAYATTNAGTAYGNEVSFTTRDGIPTITTTDVTNIGGGWATSGGNITDDEGLSVIARGVCWSTSPNPTVNDSHTTNGTGTGGFSSYITGLDVNTVYYVRAYATTSAGTGYGEQKSFETENLWVDLDLPSGLLWATCNVGADTPEGLGGHFAWGETESAAYAGDCDWDVYQHCESYFDGNLYDLWYRLTKYCNNQNCGYYGFVDNLTILFPEDDAATTNWGNDWRMPTKEEWQELCTNTTCTWVTQNGVSGRLFTASNGNSLFLPDTGGYWEYDPNRHENPPHSSGGYYWSSSLKTNSPFGAWSFCFNSDNYSMSSNNRCAGLCARAVRPVLQTFIISTTVNSFGGGETSGGGTYQEGAECTLVATAHENYTFTNWTENGVEVSTDADYTFTVNSNRILVANFTYNGDIYVDLGLPSGLLWATFNVGANGPEDYGDYFAWGETQPKGNYDWSTYQYYNGILTKYTENDSLTTLLPEDDAATANWGSDWRMPTKEELQELYNNTTVILTTQNGVYGQLFIASNGSSVFLPMAGYRGEGGLRTPGSLGYYWSSSLSVGVPYNAWFFSFGDYFYEIPYENRYCGAPVRPVRSSGQNTSFIIDATASPTEGGIVSGSGTYQDGTECTLTATPSENYTFTNWTENGEVVSTDAIYSFTVNADRTLVANFAVSGGDHAYVDLGLPSGLLWATCNVGADAPEDYGDYFAWGETQPKDTYSWSTYQYCMGSSSTMTKYCNNSSYGYNGFTDNLTTLLPEDDAATANWGSEWRMPTWAEWQELYQNTTHTWTTQNGVNGRLFTASNGNSLFLPAAGGRWNDELLNAGNYGYYWSSSLYTDALNYAWRFYFYSYRTNVNDCSRDYGQSVRAVRVGSQN